MPMHIRSLQHIKGKNSTIGFNMSGQILKLHSEFKFTSTSNYLHIFYCKCINGYSIYTACESCC